MKLALFAFAFCLGLSAQAPQPSRDPLASLAFLEGTWEAQAQGSQGATASGTYTFRRELANHILARHSTRAGCNGPEDFNCQHDDLLYVYAEGNALKAIYFDSEGHVIHYSVATPDPNTAVFLSEDSAPGPQFQLIYSRKESTMSGKFQMRMPGQIEWRPYLEWTGARK